MEGDEDQEYSANNYQIIPDLSFGRENVPVKLVADVSQIELNEDNFPYFNYITESKPTVGIQLEEDLYRLPCCACEDRCDPLTCSCCKSGPFFDEDHCLVQTDNRSILSCNSNCACSTDCPQRCVAGGVTLPLQVSWMGKKGWSLRCEADISAGRFVIEYVGKAHSCCVSVVLHLYLFC
uniref:Pre-SET domain-containing protein n=1 Tax=Palpitomonas bilix TaxID=652834 RepID=A0A7S3G7D7_9EUKA|mmetsp:Transcript_3195/g.6188  ORF Transcript_3195/g.6188 Transcript_3195/m.6188 type:complete len:179 (+) Transcript_3195:170-706(+)